MGDKPELMASLHAFVDYIVFEEQPANIHTTNTTYLSSKQLFVQNAVAGMPIRLKKQ